MPLLEVLVERVDIVSQPFALTLVGGRRIGGEEIDGRAVRRPRGELTPVAWRVRTRDSPPSAGRSEICPSRMNSSVLPSGDQRRPTGMSPRFAEGELRRRTAADLLAPEVPDRAARSSSRPAQHVGERAAVGRECGREDARQLGELDERHRPARLSVERRDDGDRAQRVPPIAAHRILLGACSFCL